MPVPGKIYIYIGDNIGVCLHIITLHYVIKALFSGEVRVCAGIALIGRIDIGIVDLYPPDDIQPLGYVILQAGGKHVAVLLGLIDHLVHDPVRVLE